MYSILYRGIVQYIIFNTMHVGSIDDLNIIEHILVNKYGG